VSEKTANKTNKEISIRSSAAEYLTFVAALGDNPATVEIRYQDENTWLTQKMLATLYDVEVPTIMYHLKKIFADSELDRTATIKKFLIVQNEDGRQVEREIEHYALQTVTAVGFPTQKRAGKVSQHFLNTNKQMSFVFSPDTIRVRSPRRSHPRPSPAVIDGREQGGCVVKARVAAR
jgi:hypothetical protein